MRRRPRATESRTPEAIAEEALTTFAAAAKEVKWDEFKPLAAKRWLQLMIPVDETIDRLQNRVFQPAAKQ